MAKKKKKARKAGEPLNNIRHEMFCKEVILNNGEITKAFERVYHPSTKSSAWSNSSALAKRPEVKTRIEELLNDIGFTRTKISKKLLKLLDSKKTISIDKHPYEIPDNSTQLETVKLGFKLFGDISDGREKEGLSIEDNRSINITLSPQNIDKLDNIIKTLSNLNSRLMEEGEQEVRKPKQV
jgi:hypothetical protein